MKIAIHHRKESFSDRWIEYLEKQSIEFIVINCYDYDIIDQLKDIDILLWHWDQNDYKSVLFARQLIFSLEKMGIKVFPDYNTCWHFDDKIGQKYLLESLGVPLVKTYLFYDINQAKKWIENAIFPKVFKLRVGAGSINVKLVKTRNKALSLCKLVFGKGFKHFNRHNYVLDKFNNFIDNPSIKNGYAVFKSVGRYVFPNELEKMSNREKGYIYFQEFIPNNAFDTRLVVVGNRCFGLRRFVRKGDFRASGSGKFVYDKNLFDFNCIKLAFDVTRKIGAQSLAFDFLNNNGRHEILEISYCYTMGDAYDNCEGYWDDNLVWHNEKVDPQQFILDDILSNVETGKNKL